MVRWLMSYLMKYRKLLIVFIALNIVSSIITQSIPKFIQYFIDVILPARDMKALTVLVCTLLGIFVLNTALNAWQTLISPSIKELPALDLQLDMLAKLRELGFTYFDQNPTGETLKLFNNDIERAKAIFRDYIPRIVVGGTLLIVAIIYMVSLSPIVSLMLIPTLVIYFTVGPYFARKSAALGREVDGLRGDLHRNIYNSLSSVMELRVNQKERWHAEVTSNSQRRFFDGEIRQWFTIYLSVICQTVASHLGVIAVMILSVSMVSSGQLTTGAFIAFLFYYLNAVSQSIDFIRLIIEQRTQFVEVEKTYEIMNSKPAVAESPKPIMLDHIRGEIKFNNIGFSYPGRENVLQGISLTIGAGTKVAWVGPSGGGKTTLYKLAGRLYDPSSGTISLDGCDYKDLQVSQLRNAIGFVFQETFLFGTTVLENIKFAKPTATPEEIEEAARAAYAHDFIMELPDGYETYVGERGVKLSGGQKQRIALARIFLKNPPIIFLDEATSALDQISENEVQLALDRLFSNRTVIAIAHRLSTIKNFDEIVVIDEGRIVERGTYDQLASGDGLFAQLVHGKEEAI